jgi:hypothetical protein
MRGASPAHSDNIVANHMRARERFTHLHHIVNLLAAVESIARTRDNNAALPAAAAQMGAQAAVHAVSQLTQRRIRAIAFILRLSASGKKVRGSVNNDETHLNNKNKLNVAGVRALNMGAPVGYRMRMHALDWHHNCNSGGRIFALPDTSLRIGFKGSVLRR